MRQLGRRRSAPFAAALVTSLLLAGCQLGEDSPAGSTSSDPGRGPDQPAATEEPDPAGAVTLAFAGDVHFEGGLVDLPGRSGSTLGPMSRSLRTADVAMVNLESALTSRGRPAAKELEVPGNRYWFRTPPSSLGLLARSGVDVVTVANNHGADYGAVGVRDAVRAGRAGRVAVVGAGRDEVEAYTPYETTVRGTDVAVLAADSSPRESTAPIWEARPGSGPGLAAARTPSSPQLLAAVRAAAEANDVVVVYLHWGEELSGCPTGLQRALAANLAEAGADVVVGTHAHLPLGAGTLGDTDTYVSYGLGNFLWYHGRIPQTGVLRLRVQDGEVVRDEWRPGRIPIDGGPPQPLAGGARSSALRDWRDLRTCTDLAPGPGTSAGAPAPAEAAPDDDSGAPSPEPTERPAPALPAFASTVRAIGPSLRRQMIGTSHDPAVCPTPLSDLRHLNVSYVDFDGEARTGRIVVNQAIARDVVGVFEQLYDARFPIQQMRLIDDFRGDDNRSMAANNSSGYNCRPVAGSTSWSSHAYGNAVDINPVQNPYVVGDDVLPPAGERFVDVDRSAGADAAPGVIVEGDVVTTAFDRLGWTWGGRWTEGDYQHFNTP